MNFNLYTTDISAASVKSALTSMKLESKGGSPLLVKDVDVKKPIVLYIVNKPPPKKDAQGKGVENGEEEKEEEINTMSVNEDGTQVRTRLSKRARRRKFREFGETYGSGIVKLL